MILLDTHALLWWLSDDPQLSVEARKKISDPEMSVFVSAATAWEIAIKRALGRLSAPDDLAGQVVAQGFTEIPISIDDGLAAGALPRHHDDPFDRMLIAQAAIRNLTVVTHDGRFAPYGVPLVLT